MMKEEQTKYEDYIIVLNMAQCLKCKDVIASRHRHDFQTCSCGELSVDGGYDYLRRAYTHKRNWRELSFVIDHNRKELKNL